MKYPATRSEAICDELHGVPVPDPYRWLEDGESEEVRAWTDAQNSLTARTLGSVPGRDVIQHRLAELLSIGTLTAPEVRKHRYFYQRREGTQNQPVLYWRDGVQGEDRQLIDPAIYEADGTAALDWWFPSPDGRLLAFGVSRHGDEKSTLYVRVVETGEDLADTIPFTRYTSLAWLPDASGFFYTRYPEPGKVPPGEENYWKKVYFHTLGTGWEDDALVFGEGRAREDMYGVALSPDGRWLCVSVFQGWAKSEVYLLDRYTPGARFATVVEGVEALYIPCVQNGALYLLTNEGAPRYRVFKTDPKAPKRDAWEEIIPEGEEVLEGLGMVGGHLVCNTLFRACSGLKIFTRDGALVRDVELPGPGTLFGWHGEWDADELFYGYVSFTHPPTVFRHSINAGTTELWKQVEAEVAADRYTTRQITYLSRDGTSVSMFIVHRADLQLDGDHPTLLYGYGGFNVSLGPSFIRGAYLLLERGGVYAMANLRGGGEYGEEWHRAGMLDRKQNVFDDCIAAAETLIREGYTRPERLALQGGSNGGLLVGAVVSQRPDLFKAAVCQVPLLDMVRYHLFSIARLWIPEYGSADDPDQFRVLHAYSPYHRLNEATRYPAMLITAAESDTRVDPLHARKFAARLQAVDASGAPILLRIETRAGHGAGKPLTKVVEEQTDVWSFLFWQLGIEA